MPKHWLRQYHGFSPFFQAQARKRKKEPQLLEHFSGGFPTRQAGKPGFSAKKIGKAESKDGCLCKVA
jgi:hypothetical protein